MRNVGKLGGVSIFASQMMVQKNSSIHLAYLGSLSSNLKIIMSSSSMFFL